MFPIKKLKRKKLRIATPSTDKNALSWSVCFMPSTMIVMMMMMMMMMTTTMMMMIMVMVMVMKMKTLMRTTTRSPQNVV